MTNNPETPGAEKPKILDIMAYKISNTEKSKLQTQMPMKKYKGPAEKDVNPLINSRLGFLLNNGNPVSQQIFVSIIVDKILFKANPQA